MKKAALAAMSFVVMAAMSACGGEDKTSESDAAVEDVSLLAEVEESEAVPQTESEYRSAISELGEGQEDLRQAAAYYEELLARDAFSEEDYEALAAVYGKLGDGENQYRIISKAHRLYPSAKYIEMLNGIEHELSAGDEALEEMMARVRECMESEDAAQLWEILMSEDWRADMNEELAGVERVTRYEDGNGRWRIVSSVDETHILCEKEDKTVLFYRGNETGAILAAGTCEDGVWDGDFLVSCFDGEWNRYQKYEGTFARNVCVGDISIVIGDKEYSGQFQEDGATAVEQQKKITNQGGVVYAYDSAGDRFLYEEDSSVESFRLDAAALGLAVQ